MPSHSPTAFAVVLAALLALALTGCSVPDRAHVPARRPIAEAVPGTPSPSPSPSPWQRPSPPPAAPFELVVKALDTMPVDNAELFGAPAPPVEPAAVEAAVTAVQTRLRDYLDAQFARPETRFSAGPISELLSPRALALVDDERRRGLGQLDLPVLRTVTGPATASMEVSATGTEVRSVLVTYEANLTVVMERASGPLRQRGVLVFLPVDGAWRADLADVTLEQPQPPPPRPRTEGAV